MPIKKASFKSLRQGEKRFLINQKVKNKIKILEKKFLKAIENKDKTKISDLFSQIQKILDKAVQKKIIKKNKAARKKARLSKLYNKQI